MMCIYIPVLSLTRWTFASARLASNHIVTCVNDIKPYQNALQCSRIVLCVCITFLSWSQLWFFPINFFILCTMDPKYVPRYFSICETKKVRKSLILAWKLDTTATLEESVQRHYTYFLVWLTLIALPWKQNQLFGRPSLVADTRHE